MADKESQVQHVATVVAGPLVVSQANPRYFTVASDNQKAIYLTGTHVNNNFHDGLGYGKDCPETPEQFDYYAYLAFLKAHGHNFIRLWRWEQFKGYMCGADVHLCMTPQPWPRTGPGTATDGKPKFDLSQFDPAYFERLRDRVVAAGKQGMYVSVMLFEGFSLHLTDTPDNIEGHPFHAANNINEIGITSIVDYQVLPLDPRVQTLEEAYIHKVIDTVQDLPNVLYEVANESSGAQADAVVMPNGSSIQTPIGDSTRWQYWVIDTIKQYGQQRGYNMHPVGMTMQYPVADQSEVNTPLFSSPADWISPGFDDVETPMDNSRWLVDPPSNDGTKVILSDNDHYSPFKADALWGWKSFLRGHNPILYDLGIVNGVHPPDPTAGQPSYASLESARNALGDTLRFAERVQLIATEPRGDLSSTGYALVNLGEEYLVLQPSETADPFTVTLAAGTYTVEWYSVSSRETMEADSVTVESDGSISFASPFAQAGPAVVYLKRSDR